MAPPAVTVEVQVEREKGKGVVLEKKELCRLEGTPAEFEPVELTPKKGPEIPCPPETAEIFEPGPLPYLTAEINFGDPADTPAVVEPKRGREFL